MKNKTITFKQYNKQIDKINLMRNQGFKPIYKKDWFRICLGCGIITISLLTPCTNIFLIPLGLFIIGVSLKDLEDYKRRIKNRVYKRL